MNCESVIIEAAECADYLIKTVANEDITIRVVNSMNQVKYYPLESDYQGVVTLTDNDFLNRFYQYTISAYYTGTNTPVKLTFEGVEVDSIKLKLTNPEQDTYKLY